MLRVVAICAVAFGCHLIVAANSDIKNVDYLKNESSVEEFTTTEEELKARADSEDENPRELNACSSPPDIDGVVSPVAEGEEYPVGSVVSYQCKFGHVSRSSGSLLSICRIDRLSGKAEWTHPNVTCVPRSCGDPGYVVNARRIGNLFTFPNSVKFECLEGYKLRGLKDRYCQVNGEWSGSLPSCVPIRCSVPSNPKNGRVHYSSLEYGTELQYECDKGFTLQNHLPRICTEDEVWSNDEPECVETICRIPKAPEHGSVQLSDEPKVGTLAFYSCNDDTALIGASTSKCLKSGDWTFDPPKCLSYCYASEFQDGELGRYERKNRFSTRQEFTPLQIGERVRHNEIVSIRCKDGYSPGNKTNGRSSEVICNDGTWSEPLLCHPLLCTGQPPSTENASPVISSRKHGFGIWYKCDPGFNRIKGGKVVCMYGKWEGYTPVCADYRCYMNELNYPGLVKPQVSFKYHAEHFVITCEKAYDVTSWKKLISCSKGKWDIKENPCTLKTCEKEPPSLNNGQPKEIIRLNGSFLDYVCDKGYEMVGHSSVHCEFGEWTGQPPNCKASIKSPLISTAKKSENKSTITESINQTSNSFQSEECFCTYDYKIDYLAVTLRGAEIEKHARIKKGEKVSFSCLYPSMDIVWPSGLRFYESMEMVCDTCQDWGLHHLPQCETRAAGDSFIAFDDQLKILPGGIIEVTKSDRFSVICENHWLQPKWNVTSTKRIHFQENSLPVIETRMFREELIIDEMDYEHIGRYECFATHHNQKQRPVVIDLKISGIEALCPELLTETNQRDFEIVYSNQRKINSMAYYTCKDPLKRTVGPNRRTCLENGKWSHSYPACEDIRCPLLNENNIFLINYSNLGKVNSVAFYYCKNSRQRLIGSSNRTCLHSGEWSGTNPVCEDITCPWFPTYNGLSVSYSRGTKVSSIASFSCLNHATLVGNPNSTCLWNGTWTHPKPSCEMLEIHCPKLDGKDTFSIQYSNDRRINSTALFFCKAQNKKIAGCNFMTCQQNGEWSGDYPTCVDYVTCDLFASSPILNVFYTDGGRVGSVASFQCLAPMSLIGSSSARCLSNGTWSQFLPTCKAPDCSIDTLMSSLPETVFPDLKDITSEFVTPGSELQLICEDSLILTGSTKALCSFQGNWEFSDVQCIPACRVNKNKTSHLIVEPEKDYYRFGDFILLSCPPGQELTSEVERMMCLGKTWSDTLPECRELAQPNQSGFSQTTLKSE